MLAAQGVSEMKGLIKIVGHTGTMPQFRIVFAGGKETMSNSEGFFTFPIDDSGIQQYSLVITKNIKHIIDKKNTLKNMSVVAGKEYRFFSFSKKPGAKTWNQTEELVKKENFVLPADSIVLLVDPKYVEQVEPWNIELPSNIVKLPVIVLKDDIDQKKLTRCAAKSLLHSLDTTTFHEPVRETIKPTEKGVNVCVSRVQ